MNDRLLDLDPHPGTATFSDDGRYRYDLTRRWDTNPLALWIMLNPSTANATIDDPTIRRCTGFARREHAGGIVVVNLFALRATQPDTLHTVADPVGPANVATIHRWLHSDDIAIAVAAWGAWTGREHARPAISELARNAGRPLLCLGHTQSGAPRHPLYVSRHAPLIPYDRERTA
jgi:hypothetical protein